MLYSCLSKISDLVALVKIKKHENVNIYISEECESPNFPSLKYNFLFYFYKKASPFEREYLFPSP